MLFPYGSFATMHFCSDTLELPPTLLQLPAYVLILLLVKGVRRKIWILLPLIVLNVTAASFALRDYCQSRRICSLWRGPTTHSTERRLCAYHH